MANGGYDARTPFEVSHGRLNLGAARNHTYMPDQDELPEMTVAELDALCLKTIRELKDRMDAYDERTAIATEALVDGKTTDERAIEALQRAERFPGEHDVARAWLKNSSTARRWSRNGQ